MASLPLSLITSRTYLALHENRLLRGRLAQLAALADHYYCAYREATALLDRRERELSDLHRRLDAKPAMIASSA